MSCIQIQSRTISSNSSVFIIAEAGDNHMGKLDALLERGVKQQQKRSWR